jgi:CubicO group peptidase (beta-lactamase class C family)
MIRIRMAFVFVLFVIGGAFADTPPAMKLPKTFDVPAVDAYVADHVAKKGFVGLSLAVVRDGQIVFAKGYGQATLNGPAVTADTAFAIGSVTKQFTCACILILAEDGKLSVRDSVAKYFPNLTRASEITLYDLMTHTSGYPDYYPLDFVDRRMVKPTTADNVIHTYATGKLDFDPGTRWSYSNTGFTILGRVVEKVSGESFEQFLQRRILKPLGMTHTIFEPDLSKVQAVRGHTSSLLGPTEAAVPETPAWLNAAGGIFAPAADIARWDIGLMTGRVLKPESFRLMTTPRELKSGKIVDYGCGLAIARESGETVLSHGGAISGFLAFNAFVPRTKSAVVVLANAEHVDPAALGRELMGLLLKDEAQRAQAVPKIAGPAATDAARAFFKQMQSATVDRSQLGEEFSIWLTEERVRAAAPRLQALGEPKDVEEQRIRERGGMEASRIRFTFASGVVEANMFRSTDGKIQQFLLTKE